MSRGLIKCAPVRGKLRAAAGVLLCCLVLMPGCKTSQDAASAATQMSATAKALSDYYAALGVILADTDQLYRVNEQLFLKPYPAQSQQLLKTTQEELARRVTLAADLSTLAGGFAKLSASTAPADVAAAAAKLQTEADTLASFKASAGEQNALKSALQLLVTAIQEHKEREAARAMAAVAGSLSSLFVKEAPTWSSVDQVYDQLASDAASDLVDQNALDPFGLTPSAPSTDLNAKLAPLAKQQIATRKAALDNSCAAATAAMTRSLQEMSERIQLVADDKPMSFRLPPVTVAAVEQWATQILSY
jgi:hypothetical protein